MISVRPICSRAPRGSWRWRTSIATGREVDAVGRQLFPTALGRGASRAEAAAVLLASGEYRDRPVRGLYQDLFGREADDSGLAFWLAALGQGMRQEKLIAALAGSPEYLSSPRS